MTEQLSERTHGVLVLNNDLKVLYRYQDKVESGELAVIKQINKPQTELKRISKTDTFSSQIKILGKVMYMICDVEALDKTELPSGSSYCGVGNDGKTALFSAG